MSMKTTIAFAVKGRHIERAPRDRYTTNSIQGRSCGLETTKITVKSALSQERGHCRQIHELKTKRKTDEKHAGRHTLLYKLDLKAVNVGQTHTK